MLDVSNPTPSPSITPPSFNVPQPQASQTPLTANFFSSVLHICGTARRSLSGLIKLDLFPSFSAGWQQTMAASQRYAIPATPRVISPSPSLSDISGRDGYFPNGTTKRSSHPPIDEEDTSDPDQRARSRSRSPFEGKRRRMSGLTAINAKAGITSNNSKPPKRKQSPNGHLSPSSANKNYWREISRSPSPLGLIPIHREWRSFIHRHEIPRKVLHVSIGFLTLHLYNRSVQSSQIHPILLTAFIPIFTTDILRHNYPSLNRIYIRLFGALMRETEVDGYNGVIWYLLGAWLAIRFFPKDVGVMSVLLLSWCDTAASTFGRLWGRYTLRIRRGKSLAGALAAAICGVGTAVLFWAFVAPRAQPWVDDTGSNAFAFQGRLALPAQVREFLGWKEGSGVITGPLALGAVSLWAGLVGSFSEAVDVFGWDDNLTIPVLCGVGLWGFLIVFT